MTSPKNLKKPTTKWNTGNVSFVEYMNNVYIPVQEQNVRKASSTIIYQKRFVAGIANQIMGVCDTLIMGLVNNRSIQSAYRCVT